MTPPIWQTPAGTLGTIPEGRFYKLALQATSPSGDVKFRLIAGKLPAGIQVKINGTLEGVPEAVAITQGVPLNVNENVTSKFTIRAYVEANNTIVVSDRTFTITVTGQDAPAFITPAGQLGSYLDSTEVSIPINISDDDDDVLTLSVVGGQLPPGLRIEGTNIVGIIEPDTSLPDSAEPGFENSLYDKYPFDFSTLSVSKNYQFTLEVTDGKESDRRQFSIYVHSRNALPLPAGITVENPPEDIRVERAPFIISSTELGRHRHDNFFASYIETVDFDGDATEIEWVGPTTDGIPLGLYILQDPIPNDGTPPAINTALFLERLKDRWIQGWIPNIGISEMVLEFTVRPVKKSNTAIKGPEYTFKISYYGDIDTGVTWNVPQHLGTIYTGVPSSLYVSATSTANYELKYQLLSGTSRNTTLPPGMALLETGEIAGRPTFVQFKLDGGTTTFDSEIATRRSVSPVTFDRTYKFRINGYSTNNIVSVIQEFSLVVADSAGQPWEKVYLQAFPPFDDRAWLKEFLSDTDVFSSDVIYRAGDKNFGVAESVKVDHIYGVRSAALTEYVSAAQRSHYKKQLVLGDLKTAQALDSDGNVIYEVVYAEVGDSMVTSDGTSVSQRVRIPPMKNRPVDAAGNLVTGVYPNSLVNMRKQVENALGLVYPVLPLWMRSKQENGRVLGFIPAWPIAYTVPGKSKELLNRIKDTYGQQLNELDVFIDRLVVDKALTYTREEYIDDGSNNVTETGWELGYVDQVPHSGSWSQGFAIATDVVYGSALYEEFLVAIGAWIPSLVAIIATGRWAETDIEFDQTNTYDKYVIFPQQGLIK